jgi:hypothetical protein
VEELKQLLAEGEDPLFRDKVNNLKKYPITIRPAPTAFHAFVFIKVPCWLVIVDKFI